MSEMKIYLASGSPRRREFLENIGLDFEVIPSNVEEDMSQKISITKLAKNLAYIKAKDIFDRTTGDRVVIGADSMVYMGKTIFGKPKHIEHARFMLKKLSGCWHRVITGLTVLVERDGVAREYILYDITKVKFIKLSDGMIEEYLKSEEYRDKAGAYAIQGKANCYVEKVKGALSTVIGLPAYKLLKILQLEDVK